MAESNAPSADIIPSAYGWREVWSGIDAANDQWLFYSGITAAPWSRDIYSNGWRLRLDGGSGQYNYDRNVANCSGPYAFDCTSDRTRFTVSHSYADALIGYYLQLGALTAKAFAGVAASSYKSLPRDQQNRYEGTAIGAKGVLELWYTVNAQIWTSLDTSFATSHNETSVHWRAGWQLTSDISAGPELRYDNDFEGCGSHWTGRAGAFARYQWSGGEISLAGGMARRTDSRDANCGDDDFDVRYSGYGTLNVLFQY